MSANSIPLVEEMLLMIFDTLAEEVLRETDAITRCHLLCGHLLGTFYPKYGTGHLDGKGKVVEYISAQPTDPMKWSILTSCLYL
jgi:hypothetical protein